MSRAFIKEPDGGDQADELPDRAISPHPNLVTPAGLDAIEAELQRLHDALQEADEERSVAFLRDLRYWTARRATAQVVESPKEQDQVRFGATVTLLREDGRRQNFKLVGEDEADPERGTLSYVSPLARALMGKSAGDIALLNGAEIEIVSIA